LRATHARRELVRAGREILGDIVEDLRAQVAAAASPGRRRVCRLDRVADVLAIALGNFSQGPAVGPDDLATVALIWPGLLPADEELVGPIDRRERGDGRCTLRCRFRPARRFGHLPS